MDRPRTNDSPVSGGITVALVAVSFLTILLVGLGITSMVTDPQTPAVTTVPATPATVKTAPAPATELPPVKTPDVPTRSQQPSDAVDTAPATPPASQPAKPSPNVPEKAPSPAP